jgi:putative transposase
MRFAYRLRSQLAELITDPAAYLYVKPMRVIVHSGAIQDREGAGLVLDKIRHCFPWLKLIWADRGYNAQQVDAAVARCRCCA